MVIDKLDYETKPHYELTVRATDTMTGSFAEAIVKIQLQVGVVYFISCHSETFCSCCDV